MGNAICSDLVMDEQAKIEYRQNMIIHKSILRELKQAQQQGAQKLILLGPGGSGKSTIFKQTRIVLQGGFTESELSMFKAPIFANIITSIHTMLAYIRQSHDALWTQDLRDKANPILAIDAFSELSRSQGDRILELWQTPALKLAFAERASYQLDDNIEYLIDNIPRITSRGYLPTPEDVVRVRVRTSGIIETQAAIGGMPFVFIDVGGQRGERRKWIHLFENIRAVLYVAAISEYDQVCAEDLKQNRLIEAIELFKDVCARLPKATIILFLNKEDLLVDKLKVQQRLQIQKSPLSGLFPDYEGGWEPRKVIRFLEKQFIAQDKCEDRDMYIHVTSAVDTQVMERVFHSVKDFILRKNLKLSSLV
eukprot:c3045_g1_i1.p1 GENE.c3045_g1_i1~~c3045_g1_i1.p1  ORF type:complete len:365 (-),score=92.44 c3045_g1_i1:263-1357(-)